MPASLNQPFWMPDLERRPPGPVAVGDAQRRLRRRRRRRNCGSSSRCWRRGGAVLRSVRAVFATAGEKRNESEREQGPCHRRGMARRQVSSSFRSLCASSKRRCRFAQGLARRRLSCVARPSRVDTRASLRGARCRSRRRSRRSRRGSPAPSCRRRARSSRCTAGRGIALTNAPKAAVSSDQTSTSIARPPSRTRTRPGLGGTVPGARRGGTSAPWRTRARARRRGRRAGG